MSLKTFAKHTLPAPLLKFGGRSYNHLMNTYLSTITGGQTDQRIVALTFDDGPTPDGTPHILDILDFYHIKATFFQLGQHVTAHPDLAREVAQRGHIIGNHTFSHSRLPDLDPMQVAQELIQGRRAIRDHTGIDPHLMRPPHGSQSTSTVLTARLLGHTIIHWSVSGDDWHGDPASLIVERVLAKVKPGCIILLHDGWMASPEQDSPPTADTSPADRTPTITALPVIIRNLLQQGYQFVTIPEMLAAAPAARRVWFA